MCDAWGFGAWLCRGVKRWSGVVRLFMLRRSTLRRVMTDGRYALGNIVVGDEVYFVAMTGARTGKNRVIPLMYVPNDDNVLVVASGAGTP